MPVDPQRKGSSLEVPTPPSDEEEIPGETKTGNQELLRVVGSYRLLQELGRGGSASVHKAVGPSGGEVAVKLMLEPDQMGAKRFAREAKLLRELGEHPHIVGLIDHGIADGLLFIAMELVEGTTLAGWLETDPPLRARVELLALIAEAVGFAHEHGVLHRDLKPGNLLVSRDGTPRVTDFNMAKELDEGTVATGGGSSTGGGIMGTIGYMAPEQTAGEKVDRRTDVYGLGVVLYEALTGHLPFRGTPVQVLTQIVRKAPAPPHEVAPRVPEPLSAICLKALSKTQAERYPSAAALAADLRRWLAGEAPRLSEEPPTERPRGRGRTLLLLLLALAGLAALAAWQLPRLR